MSPSVASISRLEPVPDAVMPTFTFALFPPDASQPISTFFPEIFAVAPSVTETFTSETPSEVVIPDCVACAPPSMTFPFVSAENSEPAPETVMSVLTL